MSASRGLQLLNWAQNSGAWIIEERPVSGNVGVYIYATGFFDRNG
jgi:hypothetical protein